MLNFLSREMSENPKGFLMSAKRLEQVALATKTAFVFPGQGSQKSWYAR